MNKSCDRVTEDLINSMDKIKNIKNQRYLQTFLDIVDQFINNNCVINISINSILTPSKITQDIFYKTFLLNEIKAVPFVVYKYLYLVFKEKIKYLNKEAKKQGVSLKEITKTYLYQCKRYFARNKIFLKGFVDHFKHNSKRHKTIFMQSFKKFDDEMEQFQIEKEKEEKKKIEEKRKLNKILPKNLILGNLNKVNNNLDKKITVYKGQFVRTFVMNLEKNSYMKFQENIKYQQTTTKNGNQEYLYDEKDDNSEYNERISTSYSPFKIKFHNIKTIIKNETNSPIRSREVSKEINKSNLVLKKDSGKSIKLTEIPRLELISPKNNNTECYKNTDLIDYSQSIKKTGTYPKIMKHKSKSVKKLNPKSFFENRDFYYL